jgi:hypothetical protein
MSKWRQALHNVDAVCKRVQEVPCCCYLQPARQRWRRICGRVAEKMQTAVSLHSIEQSTELQSVSVVSTLYCIV